jgi:DNA-binding MarR family transcriptional regulator
MALKGNLRDFPVTQILNLVNLACKTGTLVIDGSDEVVRVSFREGKLAYAQLGQEDNSLAAVLHRSRKINTAQYRILRERAANVTDKELGLMLINAGFINQQEVIAGLQQYFSGIVRRLFSWVDGFFHFEIDTGIPGDKISVRVDLENLIIEGSRQMREWEQLQAEIPSLDMSLKFTERPGANIRNVSLSVEEWRVVSYINPKNTIRQIGRATKMNDMEIRRIIYSLLQAGLVEVVRPASTAIAPNRAFPTTSKDEQKSLVNRIISRIRSL